VAAVVAIFSAFHSVASEDDDGGEDINNEWMGKEDEKKGEEEVGETTCHQ